jgi:hypothetical protein
MEPLEDYGSHQISTESAMGVYRDLYSSNWQKVTLKKSSTILTEEEVIFTWGPSPLNIIVQREDLKLNVSYYLIPTYLARELWNLLIELGYKY